MMQASVHMMVNELRSEEYNPVLIQLRTAKAFLIAIEKELLESPLPSESHLVHINSYLHNALLACRAAKQMPKDPPVFSGKQFVAPGQKMEQQWRFPKTNRKPGRKRKPNILQYVCAHKNVHAVHTSWMLTKEREV